MKPSDIPGTSGKRETFEIMLQLEHEREIIKIQQEHERELAKIELKTTQAAKPPAFSVDIAISSADMAKVSLHVLIITILILVLKRAKKRGYDWSSRKMEAKTKQGTRI